MQMLKKEIPEKDFIAESYAFGVWGTSVRIFELYRKSLGKTDASIILFEKSPEID